MFLKSDISISKAVRSSASGVGFVREFIRTSTNTGKLAARGSRFTGKAMNEDSSI